jgi:hypothetical protein
VVQEDTREAGLVAPVDLRVEQVDTLHLFEPIHHLGGFPNLYIHSSREDNQWDSQGMQEDYQVRDRQCHRIHSERTREITWH